MQAIASDLERSLRMMKTDDSKAQTLSELMGYDVDSSYREPINYIQSASTSELSIAGKSDVTGGSTLTINITDDNVILCCRRTCVVFDLVLAATAIIPENALALFQPTTISLGKLKWTIGSGQHFLQQYLHCQPKHALNKVANGLLIDLRAITNTNTTGLIEGQVNDAGTAVAAVAPFSKYHYQKNQYQKYREVTANTVRCCVPIEWIWPQLRETFSFDGQVYLGLGQQLTLSANIQTNLQFLNQDIASAVEATFTIKNANLIKVFSNLDSERQSLVLRSVLPVQKIDIMQLEAQMASSLVFSFNINEKQRAQKLYLAHHWNKAVLPLAVNTHCVAADNGGNEFAKSFSIDAAANNGGSSYKNPTTYFPQLARDINMISLSFGGQYRVLTQQQISALVECGAIMDNFEMGLDDPLYRAAHSVLVIDLSRFQFDMIGSSSGSQVALQCTITYNRGANFIFPGQPMSVEGPGVGYANFTVKAYLQTGSQAVLENGLYSMV